MMDEAIIVHQMGKVGSSTLYYSLRNANLKIPVLHGHNLTLESMKILESNHKNCHSKKSVDNFEKYFVKVKEDKEVAKILPRFSNLKVISMIRDPIARNISTFFQTIERRYDNFYENFSSGSINVDLLISDFFNKFDHDLPLTWFDLEIKECYGIDIFEIPFSKKTGYSTYNLNDVDLLIIRLEDLNECYYEAICDFLDLSKFEMTDFNIGGKKGYSKIYEEFKSQITFSEAYLDKMYNSKMVKYFYTEVEINNFRQKWKIR